MSSCEKIPVIKPIEASLNTRNTTSSMIYCMYKNQSTTERNEGNNIKQGSGGNSYNNYLLRKRGGKLTCG